MTNISKGGVLALLVGHSHATCMVAAMRRKLFPAVTSDVAFRIVGHGSKAFPGGLVLEDQNRNRIANPVVISAIDRAFAEARGRKVWLVSVIGGNAANRMAIFSSGPAVDFLLPDEAPRSRSPGAQWVPYDAIEASMANQLKSFSEFLELLPRDKLAGVAHLEGPPPCMSNDFVYSHLPVAARQIVNASGTVHLSPESIAAPDLRHRLWLCQVRSTRLIVERRSDLYIPPPQLAMDATGHRLIETCSDACHGTPEYGAMALLQVTQALIGVTRGTV